MKNEDSRITSAAETPLEKLSPLEERLFSKAQSVSLTRRESASILKALNRRIDAKLAKPVRSYWIIVAESVLLVAIISVGLLSAGAVRAMPGDSLYSWKIDFNEVVRAKLAITPAEKGRIETLLASKRLQEAESLAVRSKLDQATSQMLVNEYRKHSARAAAHMQTLSDRGDLSEAHAVSEDIENFLTSHLNVLTKIMRAQSPSGDIKIALRGISHAVSDTLASSQPYRDSIEMAVARSSNYDPSTAISIDKSMRAAEQARISIEIEKSVGL